MSIFDDYPDLCREAFVRDYPLRDCPTVTNMDGPILDLDVAVAIFHFEGNVTKIAAALQRPRRVIDTYISRHVGLSELVEDIDEMFVDDMEDRARVAARAGDIGLMKFMLSTIGKKRGYVTRVEATGKDGKDLNVHFFIPDNGRDGKMETVDGNG